MESNELNKDNEKRGKLLFLAGLISIAIFLTKVLQGNDEMTTPSIYISAGIYFVFSMIGLLWAFNFQVKLKSLMYIFQSSFFVFSEVIFVEFFFFQKFNRLYEALILLAILILIFIGNYVAFLMANVFNVNLYNRLPLLQIGRTSSYVISLLMVYFATFSFLASNFPVYVLIPLIIATYIIITLIHYMNIGIEGRELGVKTLLTVFIEVIVFLGVFLSGSTHELLAIAPALGYYFSVSIVTQEQIYRRNISDITLPLSLLVLSIVFFSIVLINLIYG